ncbi:GNAT family N-acetyltransferase [Microlunatus speluncae]|uniref:GNAT family N-acetyltransferase n=1 Tax=Microlunatus speluncae TaxID=2594267 RepID=UPI00126615BA|nr:GNAT family N-acetyltransferase [Microlunatus speluncae]
MSNDSEAGATQPIADSVRLALPGEAPAIAEIQRRIWLDQLGPEQAEAMLGSITQDQATEAWQTAIIRPPQARFRVLVAVESDRLTGFAATRPSDDPDADEARDGMIDEFGIDPAGRSRGHGSRMLNACVDTLRADGFARATLWIMSTQDDFRRFLTEAGWAPDGGHREIGTEDDSIRIKQVRLHTEIGPE